MSGFGFESAEVADDRRRGLEVATSAGSHEIPNVRLTHRVAPPSCRPAEVRLPTAIGRAATGSASYPTELGPLGGCRDAETFA